MSERDNRDAHYGWDSTDNIANPADDYSYDTDLGGIGPASSPTPKEPLENIYLFSGFPRSIPRVDPYGRKPVGELPHARGYRNGFLGEANDALNMSTTLFSVPILIYETTKVIRKPTLGPAMPASLVLKLCYGSAASFGVLAGLSLAGLEYRRFDLLKKKPGWTQEDEDARKEKNACIWSATGAVVGVSFAWGLLQPQEAGVPKIQLPRLSFSRCLALGLGSACVFANGLNWTNRSWRMMDKKLSPLSSGDEQPPIKSVMPKQYDNLPVSILPHAKGFQNGFLGEMDDAAKAGIIYTMVDLFVPLSLTDNKIGLPDFSALFRSSHESVMVVSTIRGLYVTTAILITLAALSVAGKDYRKIVDFRGERKQEQRDVDDRDEENVEGLSAIGAAGGLGLGLLLIRSPLFRPSLNAALPSQFQIFRLPLLLGSTCAGVQLANGLSYNCRKFRKWSGQ